MLKTRRISATVALIVCLSCSQWSEPVFAESESALVASTASPSPVAAQSETQPLTSSQPSHLAFGEHTLRAMALSAPTPFSMNGSQPLGSVSLAQRGWYRGRGGRRNGAAQAEMILGAVAAITGAAVLTYANRPECSLNAAADGCSYGTKVVGTAVTAGGLVTFLTGAFTWR